MEVRLGQLLPQVLADHPPRSPLPPVSFSLCLPSPRFPLFVPSRWWRRLPVTDVSRFRASRVRDILVVVAVPLAAGRSPSARVASAILFASRGVIAPEDFRGSIGARRVPRGRRGVPRMRAGEIR